jgi:hypothetical protein
MATAAEPGGEMEGKLVHDDHFGPSQLSEGFVDDRCEHLDPVLEKMRLAAEAATFLGVARWPVDLSAHRLRSAPVAGAGSDQGQRVGHLPQRELIPPRRSRAFVRRSKTLTGLALMGLRHATWERLGEDMALSGRPNALVPLAPELSWRLTSVAAVSPDPSVRVLRTTDRRRRPRSLLGGTHVRMIIPTKRRRGKEV